MIIEVLTNALERRMGMASELIHDRGRGPEIVGTRITVYNLLPEFLEPAKTESEICRIYELAPEQVAAARAYVLNNAATVLAKHLEIEAKMAEGNPPPLIEKMKETHATFQRFKEWLANRENTDSHNDAGEQIAESRSNGSRQFPKFQAWLAEEGSRPREGS
jgi:uncharacterized protein (DUF433 family)